MKALVAILWMVCLLIVAGAVALVHNSVVDINTRMDRLEHALSDLRADVRALAENEEDHDYRLAVIEPIVKLAVEED